MATGMALIALTFVVLWLVTSVHTLRHEVSRLNSLVKGLQASVEANRASVGRLELELGEDRWERFTNRHAGTAGGQSATTQPARTPD
jgi:hypothetical protein